MNDFEEQLRATLRNRADRAGIADDMSRAAIGRARTIRRRRTVATAVTAVAVVAIAVPVAVYAGGTLNGEGPVAPPSTSGTPTGPPTTVTPTSTPAPSKPSQRPSQTAASVPTTLPTKLPGPVRIKIDLTRLDRGDRPKVTYTDGDAIVVDGRRVVGKNSDLRPIQVAAAGRGAVMTYSIGDSRGLVVLDASGNEIRRIENVTLLRAARDESAVAFGTTEYDVDNPNGEPKAGTTLYHRDASSGTLRSLRIPGVYEPEIHAVIGDTVYFSYKTSRSNSDSSGLRRWVAGSSRSTRVSTVPWPTAVSDDGRIAGSLRSLSDFGSCSALLNVADGSQRWRTCQNQLYEISPDSRTVLGGPAYTDGYATAKISLLSSENGALLREWSGTIMAERFEDADHVLLVAEQDGKSAIVRCTISTGDCELATPLVAGTGDTGTGRYGLGS